MLSVLSLPFSSAFSGVRYQTQSLVLIRASQRLEIQLLEEEAGRSRLSLHTEDSEEKLGYIMPCQEKSQETDTNMRLLHQPSCLVSEVQGSFWKGKLWESILFPGSVTALVTDTLRRSDSHTPLFHLHKTLHSFGVGWV